MWKKRKQVEGIVVKSDGGGVCRNISPSPLLDINRQLTNAPLVEITNSRQKPTELCWDVADAWKRRKREERGRKEVEMEFEEEEKKCRIDTEQVESRKGDALSTKFSR